MNIISANKDGFCSRHKHVHKFNMFFVLSGSLEIKIWKNDYDLFEKTILNKFESCIVEPGEFHMFSSLSEDTLAIEIYWVEMNKKDIDRSNVGGDRQVSAS